jgi:hypothetical protein
MVYCAEFWCGGDRELAKKFIAFEDLAGMLVGVGTTA